MSISDAVRKEPPMGRVATSRRSARSLIHLRSAGAALSLLLTILPTQLESGVALADGGKAGGAAPAVVAREGDYILGPLDKVRLRVLEYRASRDEIYEWSALANEYLVGPAGRIAVPLLGEFDAAGHTTASLALYIAERLKHRVGLAVRPDASVEITQFRPIYVLGHVEKPGEYAFRPGLTVLQALTIGGGVYRKADDGNTRIERDIINVRGEIDQSTTELLALMARRARLEAEVEGRKEISFSAELMGYASIGVVKSILQKEEMLFEARREARSNQYAALAQLRDFLAREATSLEKQLASHDEQIKLLKDEMESVLSLARQKLVTQTRRLALERSIAQAAGERLRLETALMRSRQEHSRTNIMLVELDTKRITETTSELQQTQVRLEHVRLKVGTADQLLRYSQERSPIIRASQQAGGGPRLQFVVVRRVGNAQVEMPATEATQLVPGDTVRVELIASEPTDKPDNPSILGRLPSQPGADRIAPVPAAVRR
jgi:polysaccharide export outer membrane protein/exopolysaccharide production protein ExoF